MWATLEKKYGTKEFTPTGIDTAAMTSPKKEAGKENSPRQGFFSSRAAADSSAATTLAAPAPGLYTSASGVPILGKGCHGCNGS